MRNLTTILLIAMANSVAFLLVSPASAQQSIANDQPLPPHVERIATEASRLHLGMPEDEVARKMGAPTAVVPSENSGVQLRVLRYAPEPIAIKVTLSDGKVSAVALDIAGIDDPALPAYGRPIWSGIHRTAVLRIMGTPIEDHVSDSFGMKLEHMIFERPGQSDLRIFLIDGRVAGKQAGRSLPRNLFSLWLPLAPSEADREADGQSNQSGSGQIRTGMSVRDVQAMFGEQKMRVPYTVKGRPAEYRIHETASNGRFVCFTFIDDVLVSFADGGELSLSAERGLRR